MAKTVEVAETAEMAETTEIDYHNCLLLGESVIRGPVSKYAPKFKVRFKQK